MEFSNLKLHHGLAQVTIIVLTGYADQVMTADSSVCGYKIVRALQVFQATAESSVVICCLEDMGFVVYGCYFTVYSQEISETQSSFCWSPMHWYLNSNWVCAMLKLDLTSEV